MKSKFIPVLSFLLFCLPLSAFAKNPKEPKKLGDLNCLTGEIAKFDGASWVCSSNAPLEAQVADLLARLAVAEAALLTNANSIATNTTVIGANTTADATFHHTKFTDADAVAAVPIPDTSGLESLLFGVNRFFDVNGFDTIEFTGMNLQVNNGSGTNTVDGTGNVIIGNNMERDDTSLTCPANSGCNRRGGSHNLIVGDLNNYTSYGGTVVGYQNETSNTYANVIGGLLNIASGSTATVIGGVVNIAEGTSSLVSGGWNNIAGGESSSAFGGHQNTVVGQEASVLGNEARLIEATAFLNDYADELFTPSFVWAVLCALNSFSLDAASIDCSI
jgi:hypothetical protein